MAPRNGETIREVLARIDERTANTDREVQELKSSVPRDCAEHKKAIATLEAGQSSLWKAMSGKASWVAVSAVLVVFGGILVAVIKAL